MVFLFDEQYLALAGDTLSLEKKIKEKDKRIEKLEELLEETKRAITEDIIFNHQGKMSDSYNEILSKIDEALKWKTTNNYT